MKKLSKSKESVLRQKKEPQENTSTIGLKSHLEKASGKIQATKHDYGKVQFLFPIRALTETNKVFTFGGQKYDIGNWHSGDGFDYQRLYDSGLGHVFASMLGQDRDSESNLWHLAHAMCCFAMLLEHQITGHGRDTRSKANYLPLHLPAYNPRAIVPKPTTKKPSRNKVAKA